MELSINNLTFDDNHPDCELELCRSQGQLFAFVQALDLGMKGNRHKKPIKKRYWGLFSHENKEASIQAILENGGKWPDLPK